jgi:uncharacterized membrane protein
VEALKMSETEKISGAIWELSVTALFGAMIFLLTFTPIGFINLGIINATIIHVPVIIGSILLGPRRGALLGALFGAASLIRNTVSPTLLSFAFSPLIPPPLPNPGWFPWPLVICFVPRVLAGVIPYYVDKAVSKLARSRKILRILSFAAAGVAGSLTNTLLVMPLMYLAFRDAMALARGVPIEAVYGITLSIITGNGAPEAIAAGVLVSAACKAVLTCRRKIDS